MTGARNGHHVAIVGGGPAGLATATELKRLGVGRVTVVERESDAGGIPRHCGHPPFGMSEFRRILTGPAYARRLVDRAREAGVDILSSTTVTAIGPGPALRITSSHGTDTISADRVLLATGVRETPRSARLVSGVRALGIITTGALQSMVYLKNRRPCLEPVIVGSELVSFSALMTCRHAGIRPVAMVESRDRVTAWRWATLLPRLQGLPVITGTRLEAIEGNDRVTGVVLRGSDGSRRHLACDGVVFGGQFTAESSLARMSHLEIDPGTGGPSIDQFGRCSDGAFFATGNLSHPADSAGYCWREGIRTAGHIARDLAGRLPDPGDAVRLQSLSAAIRYTVPQRLVNSGDSGDRVSVGIRFGEAARGRLIATSGGDRTSSHRPLRVLPEQRRTLPIPMTMVQDTEGPIRIDLT